MKRTTNTAAIRRILANCAPLKAAYRWVRSRTISALCRVSPSFLLRVRHRRAWGRWPDLERPTTFDEKLQWLNLFWQDPSKARCGDKFTLRAYVEELHLGHLLPPLFGVYSSTAEIRLESLPDRFVLKCSHGCKCSVFCPDKRSLDWRREKGNLDSWMRTNFSKRLGELHYGKMTPRIICEHFWQDDTGLQFPPDYKVFCFRGRPYCTMVATARNPNGIAKLAFYNLEWNELPYCRPEFLNDTNVPKPPGYEEMLDCAARLSQSFPFVRVDFYSVNDMVKLGEMTFTPGACVSATYMTDLAQLELGRLIELPR